MIITLHIYSDAGSILKHLVDLPAVPRVGDWVEYCLKGPYLTVDRIQWKMDGTTIVVLDRIIDDAEVEELVSDGWKKT